MLQKSPLYAYLPATDMDRARRFYEGTLGFVPKSLENGPSVAAPGDNHFWVPGCWEYHDVNYRWRPGYWVPQQESWIWVPARYVVTPAGCVFVPGYWDYVVVDRGVVFAPVRFRRPRVVAYTPVR